MSHENNMTSPHFPVVIRVVATIYGVLDVTRYLLHIH